MLRCTRIIEHLMLTIVISYRYELSFTNTHIDIISTFPVHLFLHTNRDFATYDLSYTNSNKKYNNNKYAYLVVLL